MRVERLTALEIAQAGRAKRQQSDAVTATHPAPAKKRLILLKVAPQESLSRAEMAIDLCRKK
jgi:hypothetical protein